MQKKMTTLIKSKEQMIIIFILENVKNMILPWLFSGAVIATGRWAMLNNSIKILVQKVQCR